MLAELMPTLLIFGVVASLAAIVGVLLTGGKGKLDRRIDALVGRGKPGDDRPETVAGMARSALPKMGKVIVPEDEAERTKLRARLVPAGLYQKQAMHVFLGV